MAPLIRIVQRFARDEGGAFALMFGVMAIVLIALGGAVVDYVSLEQSRNRAQLALDAAALALQSEITRPGYDENDIKRRAQALVIERIGDSRVRAMIDVVEIDPKRGSLFLSGSFTTSTNFVRLVGVQELGARFSSEVVRGSLDIEIAIALDITVSMAGDRLVALKAAANNLINAVIQDDQSLNYTKMALVPYAQSVNAYPYQDKIRGPLRNPASATKMSWAVGSKKTGATATRDSNGTGVVIQLTNHGFAEGDWVYVWSLVGFSTTNNKPYRISNVTNNSFRLVNAVESGWYNSANSGQVIKCERANCEVLVTAPAHGYNNGELIVLSDVGGMTGLNYVIGGGRDAFEVKSATTDTLILGGSAAGGQQPDRLPYVANTGKLHCTWQTAERGCTYYRFSTAAGGRNIFPVSDCVTERAINAASDRPFTATYAGRNYTNPSFNQCISNPIVPLTSNKDTLRNAINALSEVGSTAGQLGIVWAWHMLSPNLGYLWPNESKPARYDEPNLLKAAIIMTDGEFNTVHCNGVVSWSSTDGSGGNAEKIACNAPNGTAYVQARAYCDAMKHTEEIVIFTVGFGIPPGSTAAELLTYCASGAENAFLTDNASGLDAAFQQIARSISALRISR